MTRYAVTAEGLGKQYFIGETSSTQGFRQALHSLLPALRPAGQEFWALRGASFAVAQGEAVGIIGRNGAGKSTLLKLLSRITPPTEGRARIRGRVGTLLEVGTGFHPELTGRDNIFLSGTVLGMAAKEVAKKFDQIVAFSEVEDFIDTPVKRYSSGMYTRLAFAVASFLEPEILIVDEVLAVGDAAFQRKSLGRLNEASGQEGRTVLFVSHQLHAIRAFCKRVMVLDKGRLIFDGPVEEGIEWYVRGLPKIMDVRNANLEDRLNRTSGAVRFVTVIPRNNDGEQTWTFRQGETVRLDFSYEVCQSVPDLVFLIQLRSAIDGHIITSIQETVRTAPMVRGEVGAFTMILPNVPLRPGEISLYICLGRSDDVVYYDVIDSNVDLPFLTIISDVVDKYARQGVMSLDYRLIADSKKASGSSEGIVCSAPVTKPTV
jgi:lipopolysaccharide transport system ATP-binding protein